MNIALWIVQIVLAAVYGITGFLKTFQMAKAQEMLTMAKRHSEDFVRMVGVFELLGALGVVLPVFTGILPWLTPLAAAGLALIQLLAIFTEHLPNRETKALPVNLVLFVLAVFVAAGRFVMA